MISVIIPLYNTQRYLVRCIRSILNSTYKNYEIILINDGSTDHSPEICRRFCRRDSRIKLIEQEHEGVSAARNRGIEASRGEWIVFVDSDDMIAENFLETIAKEQYQDYDLLIFNYEKRCSFSDKRPGKYTGKKRRKRPIAEILYGESDAPELIEKILRARQLEQRGTANLRSPCAKAYKKLLLDRYKIRFPEEISMGEDRLFNMEYQWRAGSRLYISQTAYFVEWRAESASHCFHMDYLQRDYRLQKRQRQLLEKCDLIPELADAYYDSVLSNMTHVLIKGIFNPYSPRSFGENCRLCRKMQKKSLYRQALEYAGQNRDKMGILPRRILLYFYQRQCYGIVNLICRLCYGVLLKI